MFTSLYVRVYVLLFICQGILYVYKLYVRVYVYKFICQRICLQVYMSGYMSTSLYVRVYYIFTSLYIRLYVYKFICQCILNVYKFICQGICLQVYMSVYTGEQCGFKLSRLYCPRSLQYLYLHTVLNPTPGR